MRSCLPIVCVLFATLGCGRGSSNDDASPLTASSLDGNVDEGETGNSTSNSSTSNSSTTNGTTETGPLLDVLDGGESMGTAGDAGDPDECTNVDILFVIDDSGSMADQQESLLASFEGFVDGIQQNLAYAESYHVGVVSSDHYYANGDGCTDLGDLVTKTGGVESSNCVGSPFTSGKRYMDQTEIDLTSKFKCVAKLGAGGSDDEMVAGAVMGALAPANQEPGACNDGFSRLDSLLVIVIISDEDDVPEPYMCDPDPFSSNPCMTTGSGGTPQEWYDTVITYKANTPENVVVLSLLGQDINNTCGAVVASKLIGFTNRFGENGFTGDVCAMSYDEFFAAALPVVDTACENYVPVG